jgi:adenylate cyclase
LIPEEGDLAIGEGRRLSATVIFTDICSFSDRPSFTAEEQEMNLRVLNLYFTEMIRVLEDYGGTVEKNTGDGLMAYFEDHSDYTPEDNSTKRAVACALTMLATNLHLLAPVYRASDVSPIEFRVSVEHGPITIARLGAARRFSAHTAIGGAANFASKMLRHIGRDQIGIGGAARDRLPKHWRDNWTSLADASTGWVYRNTSNPYPLYFYNGRWSRLI